MSLSARPALRLALPLALTTARLLMGPGLLLLIHFNAPRILLSITVVLAFLSDWFDGITARFLDVAYPWLRRYDVYADLVFYLCGLAAACLLESGLLTFYRLPIIGLLILEAACQIVHVTRFRSFSATHAYLCKGWSVLMALALVVLLGWGDVANPLLAATIVVGYLAYADVFLILYFAKQVPVDVISSYHVWLAESNRRSAK